MIKNQANWLKFQIKYLPAKKAVPRTVAAGTVAAMSTNSVPQPTPRIQELFRAALAGFAAQLKRTFLPHLIAGIGIFLWVFYVTASTLFASWTGFAKWLAVGVVFVLYGSVAFVYSLFTTCVFSLRLACLSWDDFIEDVLEQVQNQIARHVSDMNIGISKPEAKSLVNTSVREVFLSLRQTGTPWPRVLLWFGLGVLAYAVRAVLTAKILKWAGRSVQLTKLFAGRVTLVGAVFLNLHFFATLLLVLCYALGAAVLAVNIYFVFLLK